MIKPHSSIVAFLFLLCSGSIFFSLNAQGKRDLRYSEELIRKNKIDSAVIILNLAIKNASDPKEKGLAYLQLGSTYKQQQDYSKSLAAYRKALQIFKAQKFG